MKKAIVTGGSRGIGAGIVRMLAKSGYDVVFSYRTAKEEAEKLAEEIQAETGRVCNFYPADFTEPCNARTFMTKAISALGGLDLLVNNAAITKTHQEVFDLTEEFVSRMINANLVSPLLCIREAAVHMAQNGVCGSIINISSVRGQDHTAFPHDAIYAAAKAGLDRAIQSYALALSTYGIRINNVAPGAIKTRTREELLEAGVHQVDIDHTEEFSKNKIPLGRAGQPEDIANAVLFLASEAANYITGITLPVDGGLILAGMPERRRLPEEEDRGWGYVKKRSTFEI